MNLNTISYAIYLLLVLLITVWVGRNFHRNGYPYVRSIFIEEAIATSINNILLVGYYLVNIGFAILKISHWQTIHTTIELIERLSENIAILMILLGAMNIINIMVLSFFRKKKNINYKFQYHGQQ